MFYDNDKASKKVNSSYRVVEWLIYRSSADDGYCKAPAANKTTSISMSILTSILRTSKSKLVKTKECRQVKA
jgi:hypothetical protein